MKITTTGALMVCLLMPLCADACRPLTVDDPQRSTQELRAAPITSAAALASYLDSVPYDSPLLALSEPARKRFTNSITFNAGGVTGFSYADIARELTVSQAHALLALIESQRVVVHLEQLAVRTDQDRSIREAMKRQCAADAPVSATPQEP